MRGLSDLRAAAAMLKITPAYRLALQNSVVACAYFIVAKLTTLLAIAPSYVSPMWPAAGIALAAILMFGNRLWLGIFSGAFLINLTIASASGSGITALLVALFIGAAAAVQALAGAYLVRRFAQYPNQLCSEKEVLSFYLYAALISPVVGASIGVLALYVSDIIPLSSLLINWGRWWLGDSLGILVLTPVILAWTLSVSGYGNKRRLSIVLPILLIFSLSIVAFFYEADNEKKQLKLEFAQQAMQLNNALEHSIQLHFQVLQTLAALYTSSGTMTRDQFNAYADASYRHVSGVQALAWAPRVTKSTRSAFESELNRMAEPLRQISELDSRDQLQPAAMRQEYVPIRFVATRQGPGFTAGFDAYSVASSRLAIDHARDHDAVSLDSKLLSTPPGQTMLLAFMPVYGQGLARYTMSYRRSHIVGYMTARLAVPAIVATALKNVDADTLTYRLLDITDINAPQLLLASSAPQLNSGMGPAQVLAQRRAALTTKTSIAAGGRLWQFELTPSQTYIELHRGHGEWLTLLVGLLLTGLTGIFVLVLTGRGSQLAQLAEDHAQLITDLKTNRDNLEATVLARTQELKSALQSLGLSEERYELAMDAVNDGLFDWDISSNQVYVNDNYLSMLGYAPDELASDVNSCWLDLLHPTELDAVLASSQQSFQHDATGEFEFRMRCRDGSYKWIMSRRKVVERDDQAQAIRVVGTHTDITLRKHIALQLLHNEADLQTIFTQSPDGIVIFDDAHLLSDVNQLFCNMTGFDKQQLIGRTETEFNAMMQSLGDDALVGAASASQPQRDLNIFHTHTGQASPNDKDDARSRIEVLRPSYRILQHTLTALNQPRISSIVHFRDITGEATVDRMKSEFLMTAAHELRTPMTIICGYVDLLQHRSYDAVTQLGMLDSIQEQAQSIVGLLDELLDLARIESRAGKAFNLLLAPLATTIETTAKGFMMFGDTRQLKVEPMPALPLLLIDQEKISQALKNCLSNAFKYSAAPTEVSLQVAIVSRHDHDEVAIIISDHGIGMTPEQLAHIFEKFYRADISGKVSGTGLGLTLVKEIIEHHGGRVQVVSQKQSAESSPSKNDAHGTVVTLWLPIPNTKPKPLTASAAPVNL